MAVLGASEETDKKYNGKEMRCISFYLQELRQKAHTELAGFSRGMNGACVAKVLQFEYCSDTIYL